MSRPFTRVIKLGGSLLELPRLAERFESWRQRAPRPREIVIVGGGHLADQVRRRAAGGLLSEEAAHWEAVVAMRANARAFAGMLPAADFCDDWEKLLAKETSARPLVFDAAGFLRSVEPMLPGPPLPHDWSATSDSIAARLAQALAAEELVLLKSAPRPEGSWQRAAEVGYVDPYFPQAIGGSAGVYAVDLTAEPGRKPA